MIINKFQNDTTRLQGSWRCFPHRRFARNGRLLVVVIVLGTKKLEKKNQASIYPDDEPPCKPLVARYSLALLGSPSSPGAAVDSERPPALRVQSNRIAVWLPFRRETRSHHQITPRTRTAPSACLDPVEIPERRALEAPYGIGMKCRSDPPSPTILLPAAFRVAGYLTKVAHASIVRSGWVFDIREACGG
ncbi:uncharacterized protein BT62DRAFT_372760 [Guyanagaster necrorhizus]|uniref:Uncharacterized protein n=1 Tax=Guyanagaster necrorhizus TaxID=856835 RepID=A0A9P8APF3_9AGAR|nr:uncharacterized protein BT62DRAFT_372760 [Guyanagaster necrorhizus MCA 3950]KAG7442746.1 hypothetical protein BT62DRAFT_372760 [Guyanagaster necrorhizus MCA 3950]